MLKRHLQDGVQHDAGRVSGRWSLPPDYPMVAPNYALQRSKLAKDIGLGTRARRRGANK